MDLAGKNAREKNLENLLQCRVVSQTTHGVLEFFGVERTDLLNVFVTRSNHTLTVLLHIDATCLKFEAVQKSFHRKGIAELV